MPSSEVSVPSKVSAEVLLWIVIASFLVLSVAWATYPRISGFYSFVFPRIIFSKDLS
jgi:hypothetical protein